MAIYKSREERKKIWNKAAHCNCGTDDCHPNNHRLCSLCRGTILYGSHESNKSQANSKFLWNTDHIIPRSIVPINSYNNKQATHVSCNRDKANIVII